MKRREVAVLFCCCLLVCSSTIPLVQALFTSTTKSTSNSISAGTLDGSLSEIGPATQGSTTNENNQDAVSATWRDLEHSLLLAPPVQNTLQIRNTRSSLSAEHVGLTISYSESDGLFGLSGNSQATARSVRIIQCTYGGTSLLGSVIKDENGNGNYDIDDLTRGQTQQNLLSLPGINAGNEKSLTITFRGQSLGVLRAGDGISFTIRVTVATRSFINTDRATNNVVRYVL